MLYKMNIKQLLKIRKYIKKKKPRFLAQDIHKKKKIKKRWRKPRGLHSKIRLGKKGYRKKPKRGYRSPKQVRGMHKKGLTPILVDNVQKLKGFDNEKQGIIIKKSVGKKKKIKMIKLCEEKNITILNIKDPKEFVEKIKEKIKTKKKLRTEKIKKKEAKKPVKPKKIGKKKEEISEEEKRKKEKEEKDKILTKRT